MAASRIQAIVDAHDGQRGAIINILHDIQAEFGHLPEEALRMVADRAGRSLVDIYGVATFYRSLSLKPRGKHLIAVCLGTACHVRGAPVVVEEFERQLGIKAGQTTLDREFTLETVNCLGACALGPTVVADGHYFSHVKVGKVKHLVEQCRSGFDGVETGTDLRVFPLEVSCPRCRHTLMDPDHPIDGHPSIRLAMAHGGTRGWLRLSCLYGSYAGASEYHVPEGAVVDLLCPHCLAELPEALACADCGTRMVFMTVRDRVTVHVCRRRGCKGHMLQLE
ncbi:MAG: NAD(P)H-dependent oxidoreductase subunit E [Planctomycetes bacterium]|nr:NAD(P)H-dependent oxidoreductase subunit E [Planctomycetota bacterium]